MTISLADLKKSRSLDFGNITKALSKTTEGGYTKEEDDYFKLTRDKAGNGSAVIRFLPAAPGDELPWVQIYSHAFQGPTGRWYIENCLSTIGQDDPVNVYNKSLWATEIEANKKQAQAQKRKLQYIANVLVISDPGNRENEGKVMKYKFGKKIFEMIMMKVQPTFPDEAPVNVFDLWEGANFKLRIRQYEGYGNYDQSSFANPSPVAETDEEILEIVNAQAPLRDLIAPKNFKSYEELEKRLKGVLTAGPAPKDDAKDDAPVKAPREEKATPAKAPKAKAAPAESSGDAGDDDLEDYFKNLAG
jgi:gp32 DNA binding protein like